jgi:hypothetical protein
MNQSFDGLEKYSRFKNTNWPSLSIAYLVTLRCFQGISEASSLAPALVIIFIGPEVPYLHDLPHDIPIISMTDPWCW